MSTVTVELANLDRVSGLQARIEAEWLGETRVGLLRDDGEAVGDQPFDGIYTTRLEGEVVRLLPLRVFASGHGFPEVEVYAAVEAVEGEDTRWVLELRRDGDHLVAQRVAAPWSGQPRPGSESERVVINGVWIALAVGVVAWLVRGRG